MSQKLFLYYRYFVPYPTPLHCLLHCRLLYYAMLQYCTFHSQLLYSTPRYAMMLQTTSTLFFSAPLLYATVLYSLLCSAVFCCVLLCSAVLYRPLCSAVLYRPLCSAVFSAVLHCAPRHATTPQAKKCFNCKPQGIYTLKKLVSGDFLSFAKNQDCSSVVNNQDCTAHITATAMVVKFHKSFFKAHGF